MPPKTKDNRSAARNLWDVQTLNFYEIGELLLELPENLEELYDIQQKLKQTRLAIDMNLPGGLEKEQNRHRDPRNIMDNGYFPGFKIFKETVLTCRYSKIKSKGLEELIPFIVRIAEAVDLRIKKIQREDKTSRQVSRKKTG